MEMQETITKFITQELLGSHKDVKLSENDNLLLDGIVDSLGTLRLVTFIEETFKLRVPYEDITIDNFSSIKNLAAYVGKREAVVAA